MKNIILSNSTSIEIISIDNILHIKGSGSYSDVFLRENRKITVSKNLKWFESQLPATHFYRAHKSFLVNLEMVRKYYKEQGGSIELISGLNIPISRTKKKEFIQKIIRLNQ